MADPPRTFILLLFLCFPSAGLSKSTIDPCSSSDVCAAMVGYTLYAPLKVAEVATLFQVDPVSLLAANAFDVSSPNDLDNHILPARLFLKVPLPCPCVLGIRRASTRYKPRPSDTLSYIASSVFSGLVSPDQIRDANAISDPSAPLDTGLTIPLPCTCFNSSDNALPAVFLSYIVSPGDTLSSIAARYFTTVTDVMNVNVMGSMAVKPGDILSIPLPACYSSFPRNASDFGLIVPYGSYVITASHCVQCSCGPENLNLYCTPSSLAVSCSSMQCRKSNLILGNMTTQQTSSGCSVTSCRYGGFVNGTIHTRSSKSLQPRCPGNPQLPPIVPLPNVLSEISQLAPASSPPLPGAESGTPATSPGTISLPGISPANGPSGSSSDAPFLVEPLILSCMVLFFCFVNALMV